MKVLVLGDQETVPERIAADIAAHSRLQCEVPGANVKALPQADAALLCVSLLTGPMPDTRAHLTLAAAQGLRVKAIVLTQQREFLARDLAHARLTELVEIETRELMSSLNHDDLVPCVLLSEQPEAREYAHLAELLTA